MSPLVEIKARNERVWRRVMLQREAQLLERERRHLQGKARERDLTDWETERLNAVFLELRRLVRKLDHLTEDFTRLAKIA